MKENRKKLLKGIGITAGWLKAECIMTHLCLKIKRVRFMCLKLPNKNRSERLC